MDRTSGVGEDTKMLEYLVWILVLMSAAHTESEPVIIGARKWVCRVATGHPYPYATAPAMDMPSTADLPRPRPAVIATVDLSVLSETASMKVSSAFAWSIVLAIPASAPSGCVSLSESESSLSCSTSGSTTGPFCAERPNLQREGARQRPDAQRERARWVDVSVRGRGGFGRCEWLLSTDCVESAT
jgi:hypothetical protein